MSPMGNVTVLGSAAHSLIDAIEKINWHSANVEQSDLRIVELAGVVVQLRAQLAAVAEAMQPIKEQAPTGYGGGGMLIPRGIG